MEKNAKRCCYLSDCYQSLQLRHRSHFSLRVWLSNLKLGNKMKREAWLSHSLWDFISLWICCPHNKLVEENGLTSSANWSGKCLKQWCAHFHVLSTNAAHGKIWLLSKNEIIQLNITRYVLCLHIAYILFWFSGGNYF